MPDSRTHDVVRLRIAPSTLRKVEKYADKHDKASQSAALRDLIEEGLKAEEGTEKPRLSRVEYAYRAAGLVEAYGDLLFRVERHDPEGALLLLGALKSALAEYEAELLVRVGHGDE